jgi:hypothetical protein
MTEVRNLYLSKCPEKHKKDLRRIVTGILEWQKITKTVKTEYLLGAYRKANSSSECYCNITHRLSGSIGLEHSKLSSSPGGKEYACQIKIWNNSRLAAALEEYFKEKKMLVDAFDSSV